MGLSIIIKIPLAKGNAQLLTLGSFDYFHNTLKRDIQKAVNYDKHYIQNEMWLRRKYAKRAYEKPPQYIKGMINSTKKKGEKRAVLKDFYIDWGTWEVSFTKPVIDKNNYELFYFY